MASFGRCSPKTDSCLVASSVGGSLSFLVPSSSAPSWPTGPAILFLYQFTLLPTSPAQPSLFLTGYFNAQVSGFRCPSPAPPRPFLTGYFAARISGFRGLSPAPPRPFLTGYFDARISGFSFLSPAPPRLLLTGCFDAQLSGFRYLSPAPPRLLLTGYFAARISGFRCPSPAPPRLFWPAIWTPRSPFSGALLPLHHSSFRPAILTPRSPFPGTPSFPHPPFPSWFLGWPAHSLCRIAVRLRFLPLRGFYRSAVFTAPLSPVLWGLCSSAALMLAAPQSSPTSGRLALCAALRYACEFYRSAVFTAPRFLPLRFRRFFGGSALPPPSCLLPPSLRPLPGAPCGTGSSVASPVGRHS